MCVDVWEKSVEANFDKEFVRMSTEKLIENSRYLKVFTLTIFVVLRSSTENISI